MAYPTDPIYKLFKNIDGEVTCVLKEINNRVLSIPICEGNYHYDEYQKWVAEGNTAEAAD